MKTCNGFISNSSSSSFIVLFPHMPKTVEDLKEMMFPKWAWHEVIEGDVKKMPTATIQEIVKKVFQDICHGQKGRNQSLRSALDGHIDEIDGEYTIVRCHYDRMMEYDEAYKQFHKLVKKYGELEWDQHGEDPDYKAWKEADIKEKKMEKEYYKERDSAVKIFYNDFRNRYKYHEYRKIFEYGDRHGEYIFENGYIFRNLPHIVASNH